MSLIPFLEEKISSWYTETQTGGLRYPSENTRRIFPERIVDHAVRESTGCPE